MSVEAFDCRTYCQYEFKIVTNSVKISRSLKLSAASSENSCSSCKNSMDFTNVYKTIVTFDYTSSIIVIIANTQYCFSKFNQISFYSFTKKKTTMLWFDSHLVELLIIRHGCIDQFQQIIGKIIAGWYFRWWKKASRFERRFIETTNTGFVDCHESRIDDPVVANVSSRGPLKQAFTEWDPDSFTILT